MMMIGLILGIILLLREAPELVFQPLGRHRVGNLIGQWVWVPKRRMGESNGAYKRRYLAINRRMFRRRLSLSRWYLELRTLWRYPHYRRHKVKIIRAMYKANVPWRMDWVGAFVRNPYYAPGMMPFRDYYIAKWVPDIRIQAPLRSINRNTVMMVVGMILIFIGIPMPMLIGANYYFHTGGDDTTGDGSITTPWKTQAKYYAEYSGYSPGDVLYFERGGNFRNSVNGGGDALLRIRASGTSGSAITTTGYGTGDDPIVERVYIQAEYNTLSGLDIDNTDTGSYGISVSETTADCKGTSIIDCRTRNTDNGIVFLGQGDKSDALITGCTMEQGGTGVGFYFDSGTGGVNATDISFYNNTIDNPGTDGFTFHEGGSDTQYYTEGPIIIHDITFTGLVTHTEELIDIVTGTYGEMYAIDVTLVDQGISYGHSAGCNGDTSDGQWHFHNILIEQTDSGQQSAIRISGRNLKLYNSLVISNGSRSCINISDTGYASHPAPGVNTSYSIDDIEIYYCVLLDSGISGYGLIYYVHDSLTGFEDGGVTIRNTIHTSTQVTMNTKMFHIGGTQSASFPLNHACLDLDYNCYHDPNGGAEYGIPGELWADLQSAGHEANGMESDPKLIDRTGGTSGFPDDAELQSDSPCISSGLDINTGYYYDANGVQITGIRRDYNNGIRDGPPTDIGAFEYGAGSGSVKETLIIGVGDTWRIANGEEWSDFEVENNGTIVGETNSAVFYFGPIDNSNGRVGTNTFAGNISNTTVTGCGEYLGSLSSLEPPECSLVPPYNDEDMPYDSSFELDSFKIKDSAKD